jgi:PST family polysaccharide transporter/lipopolysaccharide exporter
LRSVGKTTGPVFQALGRPDIVTKLAFVRLVLIAIFIIPAVRQFGIEGAAMVIVGVALFPMLLLDIYALSRLLEASYRQFFRDIMYPLLASGVMFAAVVSVRQQVVLSGVPKFLLLLVTGVLTYVVAIGVIELRFGWGIRRNLKSLLSIVSGS